MRLSGCIGILLGVAIATPACAVPPDWSGYYVTAAQYGAPLNNVDAWWVVPPQITYVETTQPGAPPLREAAATWIGLGGVSDTFGGGFTGIRIGTVEQVNVAGGVTFAAFYSPGNGTTLDIPINSGCMPANLSSCPISGGDTMIASIELSGVGVWSLELQDKTQGWLYTTSVNPFPDPTSSAEWIQALYEFNGPLPNYRWVEFAPISVNGGGKLELTTAKNGATPDPEGPFGPSLPCGVITNSVTHVSQAVFVDWGTSCTNGIVNDLVAAVLPESQSVQIGGTTTAFATIINTGMTDGTDCSIAPALGPPATFLYQTTDPATNALTGSANTPVTIAAGASQSFVMAFTPSAPIAPTNELLFLTCTNTAPAPIVSGLNTLLLSASATPVPDIIALAATTKNDGIVHVTNGSPPTGVFAVATDNLGSGDTITAATNTGSATLPITVTVCQTNPKTGACLQAPSATAATTTNPGATPTFGIFVSASAAVPFDPTNNRIFVTFTDSTNAIRGETSVAVETQ